MQEIIQICPVYVLHDHQPCRQQ